MEGFRNNSDQAADNQEFYQHLIERLERKSKKKKSKKKGKKQKKEISALKEQVRILELELVRLEYDAKFSQFTAYISGYLGIGTDIIEQPPLPRLGSGTIEEQRHDDRMQ